MAQVSDVQRFGPKVSRVTIPDVPVPAPVEIRDRTGLRGSYDDARTALVALAAIQSEEPCNTELVIIAMAPTPGKA